MCLSRDGRKPRLCRGGGRRAEPRTVQRKTGSYWGENPWMLVAFGSGELRAVGRMDLQFRHLHMFPAQTSWDAASFLFVCHCKCMPEAERGCRTAFSNSAGLSLHMACAIYCDMPILRRAETKESLSALGACVVRVWAFHDEPA